MQQQNPAAGLPDLDIPGWATSSSSRDPTGFNEPAHGLPGRTFQPPLGSHQQQGPPGLGGWGACSASWQSPGAPGQHGPPGLSMPSLQQSSMPYSQQQQQAQPAPTIRKGVFRLDELEGQLSAGTAASAPAQHQEQEQQQLAYGHPPSLQPGPPSLSQQLGPPYHHPQGLMGSQSPIFTPHGRPPGQHGPPINGLNPSASYHTQGPNPWPPGHFSSQPYQQSQQQQQQAAADPWSRDAQRSSFEGGRGPFGQPPKPPLQQQQQLHALPELPNLVQLLADPAAAHPGAHHQQQPQSQSHFPGEELHQQLRTLQLASGPTTQQQQQPWSQQQQQQQQQQQEQQQPWSQQQQHQPPQQQQMGGLGQPPKAPLLLPGMQQHPQDGGSSSLLAQSLPSSFTYPQPGAPPRGPYQGPTPRPLQPQQQQQQQPRRPHPPPPPLPKLRQDVAQLDHQLVQLVQQLQPTPDALARQQGVFDHVSALLRQRWPAAQVCLFGSAASRLAVSGNNDIDVCLELAGVDDTREAKGEVVEELGLMLVAGGMAEVLAIPRARMPVVKFRDAATGTKADITINNHLAVVNTKLLRDYSSIDPRLRQLVLLVKFWAKRRKVNDAYVGTLSSYAYTLMCISHLQRRLPPVLPILQEMQPTHVKTVGEWSCDYHDCVEQLAGYGRSNKESVAQLLASFFQYWAQQHDYRGQVISIRSSTMMSKGDKGWTTRVGSERHLLSIEDPFELSHDLGRTVGWEGIDYLRKEFRRAWDVCRTCPDVVSELFKEAPEPVALQRPQRSVSGGQQRQEHAGGPAAAGLLAAPQTATARDVAAEEAVRRPFVVGSM